MGAWGYNSFENDSAADWAYDLLENKNPASFLSDSLAINDSYIECDTGCTVIAAAEILCSLKFGARDNDLDEDLLAWIEANKGLEIESLCKLAAKQVQLVLAENSELNELWSENTDDYESWKNSVRELAAKLSQ